MSNQHIRRLLPQIITHHFTQPLLNRHVVCAIGYGSGVFPQTAKPTNNTIDLIMVVKNRENFHQQMHKYKPHDYAGLSRYLGSGYLNILNELVYPLHFNHVQVEDTKLKYAVVDVNTFMYDLRTWRMLTLAGRMHKPVFYNILNQLQSAQLDKAVADNYKMALTVGLLNLIGKVSLTQPTPIDTLYSSVSNISYAGDIRHTIAVENKNKVDNIVRNNRKAFATIYEPFLKSLSSQLQPDTLQINNNETIKIKYTPQLVNKLLQKDRLPEVLVSYFTSIHNPNQYKSINEKFLMEGINYIPKEIRAKLGKINRNSSIKMAVENFLGASLINNIKYLLAKINKKQIK